MINTISSTMRTRITLSMMDSFIENCLSAHNVKRKLHGAPPLRHDRLLDRGAQEWAEELIGQDSIKNSPLSGRGDVGESISLRTSTAEHVDIEGNEVVDQWYADQKNYNYDAGKGPAGNFTQLIWNSTREVGFGKSRASGKCIIVAHYRPPGNIHGRYLSNVAKPIDEAQRPSSSTTDSFDRLKRDDSAKRFHSTDTVCKDGKTYLVEKETVESVGDDGQIKRSVVETFTEADPAESSKGAANNRSSVGSAGSISPRAFASTVVDLHNKFRAKHGASPLMLDMTLSNMAQQWAEELCALQHLSNSGYTHKGLRLGENVFCRWSNGPLQLNGSEVVEYWYKESEKFKYDSEPTSIQGIGAFSQLVWQDSQLIGVGQATSQQQQPDESESSSKLVAVCFYFPPGNINGQFGVNVKPIQMTATSDRSGGT